MRKSLIYLVSAITLLLVGCSDEEMGTEPKKEPVKQEQPKKDIKKEPKIDTSMYHNAKVDVTNAIDTNKHITLKVDAKDGIHPGSAFSDTLRDTHKFMQQESVKKADTVTVLVRQEGIKTAQFTVDQKKFSKSKEDSKIKRVLKTSVVETVKPEAEEYLTNIGLELNKK